MILFKLSFDISKNKPFEGINKPGNTLFANFKTRKILMNYIRKE